MKRMYAGYNDNFCCCQKNHQIAVVSVFVYGAILFTDFFSFSSYGIVQWTRPSLECQSRDQEALALYRLSFFPFLSLAALQVKIVQIYSYN